MKGKTPKNKASYQKAGLTIRAANNAPLSRTQVEFNRLIKSLETTKARHASEQARLDEALVISSRELMPLVEELNRATRDLVFNGHKAMKTLKLNANRLHWLGDLLSGKASVLVADPVGISEKDISELEAIIGELGPSQQEQEMRESVDDEFNALRAMMEQAAREAGAELDLSGLDPNGDPAEFERTILERIRAVAEQFEIPKSPASPRRKPTKAQAEKERKRLEQEDAKNRDLKSLFKQLAKALHPDLEPDPLLKEHKKVWMQRLNTAYAAHDLREMLQLEMEWLGEEASNLATAGDEKLKVYCMVLKEQITDLKAKTHALKNEPQYSPLRRFIDPFYGTLASPVTIKRELHEEVLRHRDMLVSLSANNANSRRMIYDWVDDHERSSSYPF
jgi:hypothetical protein